MRLYGAIALATLLAASAPRPAHALRVEREGRGPRGGQEGGPLDRILDFQISRMTEDLQLSEEQVSAIAPRMRRLADAQVESRRRRNELLQQMEEDSNAGREEAVREDLARLKEHDERSDRRLAELQKDISSQLSPRQQARYVLFNEKFKRELQGALKEVRRKGGERPPELEGPRRKRPNR